MKEFSDTWRKVDENSTFITDIDREFINACDKYVAICVECSNKIVNLSMNFNAHGNIFAKPKKEINSRFDILKITANLGIGYGPGNGGSTNNEEQCQVYSNKLTKCIYKQIDNEWHYKIHTDTFKKLSKNYNI